MDMDTIAAIATPAGSGGIGIIRISGSNGEGIAHSLFRRSARILKSAPIELSPFQDHRLNHGFIYDPHTGSIIDEVLLVFMAAPHSYTCEDVVEIHSHSGPAILKKLLTLVLEKGARLAEPGEFTRRAFLNGRIDLSQAEAVADMISAKTENSLHIAAVQLSGEMKCLVEDLIDSLVQMIAGIQAEIEFPEEMTEYENFGIIPDTVQKKIIEPIQQLLQNVHSGNLMRDGLSMGIVGRPNVGKSSLMNRLLGKDKAIIAPFPGTTRDPVEDFFILKGIPIHITDTAGLHLSDDPLDLLGMEKTKQYIARSDLILFVMDARDPFNSEDQAVFWQLADKKTILVINKTDLGSNKNGGGVPALFKDAPAVWVSALNGQGVDGLRDVVVQWCLDGKVIMTGNEIAPNLRQKVALENALSALQKALIAKEEGLSEDLIVSDLERAQHELEAVVGKIVDSDILDDIFKRFCIGK